MYEPIGPKIKKKLSLLATNSSLTEIRSWIKPGNVHRTVDFPNTTYQDFLSAAYNAIESWKNLYETLYEDYMDKTKNIADYYTEFLIQAVDQMMSVQKGGNVLLGHFMLIAPVFITSAFSYHKHIESNKQFWDFNMKILEKSSYKNTIDLYKAINAANPGGLGKIDKYDLTDENSIRQIETDNVTLLDIFVESAERDTISRELGYNYQFIRNAVMPRFVKLIDEYGDSINPFIGKFSRTMIRDDIIKISPKFNELIVRLYLFILGSKPDTLIVRKTNVDEAENVSKKSMQLYNDYYSLDPGVWFMKVDKFDVQLQKNKGKTNPGTTADLLATSIFLFFTLRDLEFL